MYERILLPTDGSVGMASAIKHAFHQAERHDAVVHALYVVDVRAYVLLADGTQERVKQLLRGEGERALDALEEYAAEQAVPLETAIQDGIPHEAILDYVDEHDIDLIVMGTHGRSGEQHRIVGSVAEEVVRNAEVPVMTVRMSTADLADAVPALSPEALDDVPEEQQRYIR